jgi:hypothetical protein
MIASLHTNLLMCVSHNDSANSSDCLLSNVWLMNDELVGEGNITAVLFRLATIQKVACSIPECVIGSFHLRNPSGRTMALGSNKPLTEMSTRNISWGVKAAVVVA